MLTRIQRRRIARRIVAAGLAIGTGTGIAVLDATAAASGAPVCLADGPVTYRPSPGQAPITVPACPRKAPPATCAEVVGSDGYSHPLGQPDVNIPKCQPPAAPRGTARHGETVGEQGTASRRKSLRERIAADDARYGRRKTGTTSSTNTGGAKSWREKAAADDAKYARRQR